MMYYEVQNLLPDYAELTISDDKKLIRIGSPQMIYFEYGVQSLY